MAIAYRLLLVCVTGSLAFRRQDGRVPHDELEAQPGNFAQVDEDSAATGVRAPGINVLQFNLAWECMSGVDFGSGKYSAKHCKPGRIVRGKGSGEWDWEEHDSRISAITRKMGFQRSNEEKHVIHSEKIMDTYMTSGSMHMLRQLKQWHAAADYQLITFQELCSPGANSDITKTWGGGFAETDPKDVNLYNFRQCSLHVFDALTGIFDRHRFHINQQLGNNGQVHQLTIWNHEKFGTPEYIVNSQVTPGRPMTALFFKDMNLLVVNCHNIHYRKVLINPMNSDARTKDGQLSDMFAFAYDRYKRLKGRATKYDEPGSAYNLYNFDTTMLQTLYGEFLSYKIAQGMATQFSRTCKTAETCADLIRRSVKRIIVMGDMNDETGELIRLPMFGQIVSVDPERRKRNCCSCKSKRFLFNYSTPGDELITPATRWDVPRGYANHSQGFWEYLLKGSRYLADCPEKYKDIAPCVEELLNLAPNVLLKGSDKGAPTNDPAEPRSNYPFVLDLILDSVRGGTQLVSFPNGYRQILGDGTISDHDPVHATLAKL